MADIFQEVDDAIRQERLEQIWKKHGTLILVAAFVVLVAVGGWRGYQWWDAKQSAEMGSSFNAAVALAESDKKPEAEAAFAKIVADGSPAYRSLARLRAAGAKANGDVAGAVAAYDDVANDASADTALRDLAAVRAGMLVVDTAPYADVLKRLEALAAPDRPFRHSARELLALSAWKAGDAVAVKRWFDAIQADPETPATVRARVDTLLTLSDANKS